MPIPKTTPNPTLGETARILEKPIDQLNIIACHIGYDRVRLELGSGFGSVGYDGDTVRVGVGVTVSSRVTVVSLSVELQSCHSQ